MSTACARPAGRPVGQIGVRGPGCTPGYVDDEEANARLFASDGWMLTGDLAHLDAGGWLTLSGRAADFIIRGGHNVSAPAVEAAVGTHPRVAQVAVEHQLDEGAVSPALTHVDELLVLGQRDARIFP